MIGEKDGEEEGQTAGKFLHTIQDGPYGKSCQNNGWQGQRRTKKRWREGGKKQRGEEGSAEVAAQGVGRAEVQKEKGGNGKGWLGRSAVLVFNWGASSRRE